MRIHPEQFDREQVPPSVALKVTLKLIGHIIFIFSLLLGIGYVDAKGEEIDAKINNHINHLIR